VDSRRNIEDIRIMAMLNWQTNKIHDLHINVKGNRSSRFHLRGCYGFISFSKLMISNPNPTTYVLILTPRNPPKIYSHPFDNV
jgi:hypothetical protein